MSSSEEFLQVLNSWKDSEGVIVCVHWSWSSGLEAVTFSFRAYVVEADKEAIHFATDEDKGNVSMLVSLKKSRVTRIDKREVALAFDSGALLSMSALLQ